MDGHYDTPAFFIAVNDSLSYENPGRIGFCYFPHVFAHELGHALGFFHVPVSDALMCGTGRVPCTSSVTQFNAKERYHGRLAYEVGNGAEYCGWPFSAGCSNVRGLMPPAELVVDCGPRSVESQPGVTSRPPAASDDRARAPGAPGSPATGRS